MEAPSTTSCTGGGSVSAGIDFEARKAEEAAFRRYDAAGWLRKMVGVVAGKDLPAQPSEEEFRHGLRSGIILCNVLNKVQPGVLPKVVDAPCDPLLVPEGTTALSAYQYFENVRNFLDIIQGMGIPTFEASDLEKGGKSSRIINCVLALKSYSEWKQSGGTGLWKFSGTAGSVLATATSLKSNSAKYFLRKNSDPFTSSLFRNHSINGDDNKKLKDYFASQMTTDSLSSLVRDLISDKKPDEIPTLVESVLSKVIEQWQHHVGIHDKSTSKVDCLHEDYIHNEDSKMDSIHDEDSKIKDSIQNEESKTKDSINDVESETKDSSHYEESQTKDSIQDEDSKSKDSIHDEDSKTKDSIDNRASKTNDSIQDEESKTEDYINEEGSKARALKHVLDRQKREVEELRQSLHNTKEGMLQIETQYHDELGSLGKCLHSLAHTASGYRRLVEENRKLYNQVQDLKGSIRVYCRVRPLSPAEANRTSVIDHIEGGTIRIITPSKHGKGHKSFRFNQAFGPSATQEEVFADTRPLIRSVLDGFNVCIFAYGQTGSGKTHTMTGPKVITEETQGVNYRALGDLFLLAEQRKETCAYEISVQMLEIYNETIRDLLVTDGITKRLEIRNTGQKGLNVPDANILPVKSTSDVIELMNTGHKNRVVSATALNDRSSRSHSCLTIHVQGRDMTSGSVIRGCLHLVDLAGSERVSKSEVTGEGLKEAVHINKSLSALGDVISSLAAKSAHVPYRNSKLTQLLQDSLGGQAKTLMFVHISPDPNAVGETLSTLKFAERVATVELGAAKANQDSGDVKELKEQIANLKAALAAKNEGEPEHFFQSVSSSPERFKVKAYDTQGAPRRQPTDTVAKKDEKELGCGDWVDKVIVKEDFIDGEDNSSIEILESDKRRLSQLFYDRHLPDSSKVFPDQAYNKFLSCKKESPVFDIPKNRYDAASTTDDESDDLDATTSDSSEPDLLWQFSIPKSANGVGSKIRKPLPKSANSPDRSVVHKSSIPTLIPSPARKVAPVYRPPLHQNLRQQAAVTDGKRKSVNRK